jgi:hypothetical protein
MESLARWGSERGIAVEPYGLEISWRLAALARRSLPQWRDRIWVGNAITFTAPRRFDVVHSGIDYVPVPQRRAYLLRLMRDLMEPGGRLVLRAERVVSGQPDLVEQMRALDLPIQAVLESRHPDDNTLRRTVCLGNTS